MEHFSFLLGSGFSIPEGYPTMSQINERLKVINQNEIFIHTDRTARFINEKEVKNQWMSREQKLFVQRFLEFYNQEILAGGQFNYEEFYDFYHDLMKSETLPDNTLRFFERYKKEADVEFDHYNILMNFDFTFNQLLSRLLMIKWPEPVTLMRPYYGNHSEFLELLHELGDKYKVHILSLNHDLLMESYFHTETLGNRISDGFTGLGSPFYAEQLCGERIQEKNEVTGQVESKVSFKANYLVRLRMFTNDFSGQYCLYKLHGSIDNYVFNFKNSEYSVVKLPFGVSKHTLVKEFINDNGNFEYFADRFQFHPDFLSGTLTKIESYKRESYYKHVFEHFRTNLKQSNYLIIIGYGFGDRAINEYLIENFLTSVDKKVLIIDIKPPQNDFLNRENVKVISKSISDISKDEILYYLGDIF